MDFLEQYAGVGTEYLAQQSGKFLRIAQRSDDDTGAKEGEWYHAYLKQSLGKSIEVVLYGWYPVWVEKNEGNTVANHAPKSIPIREEGSGKTYACYHAETGNKIERTFILPLSIYNIPDSYCFYIPSVSSREAIGIWRKRLSSEVLPSGNPAPIFAKRWFMQIGGLVKNQTAKGTKVAYYSLEKVLAGEYVDKDFFTGTVQPLMQVAANDVGSLLTRSVKAIEA